jgi:hypothetical protein
MCSDHRVVVFLVAVFRNGNKVEGLQATLGCVFFHQDGIVEIRDEVSQKMSSCRTETFLILQMFEELLEILECVGILIYKTESDLELVTVDLAGCEIADPQYVTSELTETFLL